MLASNIADQPLQSFGVGDVDLMIIECSAEGGVGFALDGVEVFVGGGKAVETVDFCAALVDRAGEGESQAPAATGDDDDVVLEVEGGEVAGGFNAGLFDGGGEAEGFETAFAWGLL